MTSQRRTMFIGGGLAIILAIVGITWWFSAPAPAEVDIAAALEDATTPPAGSTATRTAPATPTATATQSATPTATPPTPTGQEWTVSTEVVPYDFDAPAGTFAGFRIDEELTSVGASTAVARSPQVSGSLTVQDEIIADGGFTVDLTALVSDRQQRNGAIQRTLDTVTHPDATFTLTEPVELDAVPPVGEAITAQATGDLTINGVTNSVTIPLQAALVTPSQLVVTSSFDVTLADYDITAPAAPAVVSVSNIATVELQLYFVP